MKNLFRAALVAVLLTASCASTASMIDTTGPFQRTTDRVIDRHDAYVIADEGLTDAQEADALAGSASLAAFLDMSQVQGALLSAALAPVTLRHDIYVTGDVSLDPLERDVYLMDSTRLSALVKVAAEN